MRVRFSLRTLFVLLSLFCVSFCRDLNQRQTHEIAFAFINKYDVYAYGEFEDPIGPNFLFTGDLKRPPGKVFFPTWFSKYFCVNGYTTYHFANMTVDNSCISSLKSLLNLNEIIVDNTELPVAWLEEVSRCGQLRRLMILSNRFSQRDASTIAIMTQIEELVIDDVDLSAVGEEFMSAVVCLHSLKQLWLGDTQLSDAQILCLKNKMPWCEIEVVTTSQPRASSKGPIGSKNSADVSGR